jgi:hypothetical protein
MQLINLTVSKKNGVSVSQNIAVDVDDLSIPIRFNSDSKSYFSLLSKSPTFQQNSIFDDYEVDEDLATIKAISAKLLLLTVTTRNNFTVTTEQMIFNASHVIGDFLTVGGGTEFLYAEYGNPTPVKYLVTESITTIMAQQAVGGGGGGDDLEAVLTNGNNTGGIAIEGDDSDPDTQATMESGTAGKMEFQSVFDDGVDVLGALVGVNSGSAYINAADVTNAINTTVGVSAGAVAIGSTGGAFVGATYNANYSANFVDRSLVDKAYVDSKQESFAIAASDETTALTTGTNKVTFRIPYDFTLTKVKASLTTAPAGGMADFEIDIKRNGVTVFTTTPTIDVGETTTETATVPSVLEPTEVVWVNDDVITIDIVSVNGGIAAGLKVYLIGHQ